MLYFKQRNCLVNLKVFVHTINFTVLCRVFQITWRKILQGWLFHQVVVSGMEWLWPFKPFSMLKHWLKSKLAWDMCCVYRHEVKKMIHYQYIQQYMYLVIRWNFYLVRELTFNKGIFSGGGMSKFLATGVRITSPSSPQ